MTTSILGTRIRQRRREIGVTQAKLATDIGISASYLNLIEWNKRPIAGTLLRKIADTLNIPLTDLDDAAEHRLFDTLNEVAHLQSVAALGIEDDRINELIGRFPGWARGIAALAHSEHDATVRLQALSDRMSNDPFLNETVHKMLTRIAAIRSAAEILTEYHDIDPERRITFDRIVLEEGQALSDVGEALAAYLDKSEEIERALTPTDEVEAFFNARVNHIEEIEAAVKKLSTSTDPHPVSRLAFARTQAETELGKRLERIIDAHPQIETSAAKKRAREALLDYAAAAIVMPLDDFTAAAAGTRYDIEALAETFTADIDTVCHRMTAIPHHFGVPRFGYLRANAAGTIVEMRGLERLAVPRYAAACPLWVLFRAQQSPETFIRQRVVFPSGARFVFVARAVHRGPAGFGKPRHYITVMTAMSEEDAQHTVYAPAPTVQVEEVGPGCRLCPRTSCFHRIEDPLSE